MSEVPRAVLLSTFAAMASEPATAWPRILEREAARHALPARWCGDLHEQPPTAAVRVAHSLEMGSPGLQAWSASWRLPGEEAPPLQLAAAAAALLAGQEGLLLLVAPASGQGESEAGALIDADSCARMAVAGYDPETEIRLGNCAELLAAAGDRVTIERATPQACESLRYLVLGMKWHAPAGH
jgi:hypothetical protein